MAPCWRWSRWSERRCSTTGRSMLQTAWRKLVGVHLIYRGTNNRVALFLSFGEVALWKRITGRLSRRSKSIPGLCEDCGEVVHRSLVAFTK